MKNEQLSRAEKVSRLKRIMEGKASIKDIAPHKLYLWQCEGGIYTCLNKEEDMRLTKEGYDGFCKRRGGNAQHVVFVDYSERANPLNENI